MDHSKGDSLVIRNALLHGELSGQVIGAFYEVHRELGAGFVESCYQRAMMIALGGRGIPCESEVPIEVSFRNESVGKFRIDLLVDRRIVVECKVADLLAVNHRVQLRNYLKATGIHVGLILLFGSKPVFERVIYQESTARDPIPGSKTS